MPSCREGIGVWGVGYHSCELLEPAGTFSHLSALARCRSAVHRYLELIFVLVRTVRCGQQELFGLRRWHGRQGLPCLWCIMINEVTLSISETFQTSHKDITSYGTLVVGEKP